MKLDSPHLLLFTRWWRERKQSHISLFSSENKRRVAYPSGWDREHILSLSSDAIPNWSISLPQQPYILPSSMEATCIYSPFIYPQLLFQTPNEQQTGRRRRTAALSSWTVRRTNPSKSASVSGGCSCRRRRNRLKTWRDCSKPTRRTAPWASIAWSGSCRSSKGRKTQRKKTPRPSSIASGTSTFSSARACISKHSLSISSVTIILLYLLLSG